MRILHIIESLEFGGAEKVTVDLANATATQHNVGICCVKKTGELATQLRSDINLYCLNKGEGNDISLPLKLKKIIARHGAEIVHLHDWGAFLETGIAALWCPGVRVIQTSHGPYTDYAGGWANRIKKTLRHSLELILAQRYYRIVAVADSVKADMRKRHLPNRKLTTIRNGISTQSPTNQPPLPGMGGTPQLITVARLAPIKNQTMMLDSFKQVLSQFEDARLLIVGDGPLLNQLKHYAEILGIANQVVFAGYRTDAAALLANADLFLLSSNYEGISISILEAMRAGLPVVATNVGGIPETVIDGATGMLSAPGDAAAFTDSIISLCADSQGRQEMAKQAKKRLLQEFSIASMRDQYLKLYGAA